MLGRQLGVLLGLLAAVTGCDVKGLLGGDKDKPTPSQEPGGGNATPIGNQPSNVAGRSAVPTLDEWNKVGEVTVKGSSALGCQTKMVREWLRVSCSGKNDTGGTPTSVKIDKGAGSDRFTFAQNAVTSLVMPFEDGVQVEATFSWTDKSHKLTVSWPRGAPKPPVVGTFQGASSPLDAKACRSATECPTGHFCCLGPPGQCRSSCDTATSVICTGDGDCPAPSGKQHVCKSHPSGLKTCQPK